MFQRLRPLPGLCVALGVGLSAVVFLAPDALAEGLGLAGALPAGAAFAAPAIAVVAALILWRLLRAIGSVLTIGLGIAIAIALLMASDGRLELDRILAPLRAAFAAWT
jgi:hypothetical protein